MNIHTVLYLILHHLDNVGLRVNSMYFFLDYPSASKQRFKQKIVLKNVKKSNQYNGQFNNYCVYYLHVTHISTQQQNRLKWTLRIENHKRWEVIFSFKCGKHQLSHITMGYWIFSTPVCILMISIAIIVSTLVGQKKVLHYIFCKARDGNRNIFN